MPRLTRDEQGTTAAVAGLHSTGIAGGALLGGALFAPLARRVGHRRAIWIGPAGVAAGVTAIGVSLAGFTLFWAATVGWLAVVGLVVLGLGNALHYPLAISIALTVAGPAADKAAGWSSYSMAVGFGIAPVALGWVADGVGPHLAFLLLPGFIAAAAALAARLGRPPVTFFVAPTGVAGHRPRHDSVPLLSMIWGVLSPRFGGCQ